MSVNYEVSPAWYEIAMATDDICALEDLLTRLRSIYAEMSAYPGGIAMLHLEAAIASLESHLRRQRADA